MTPSDVAQLAVSGGDIERSFEWMQRGVDRGDPNAAYVDLFLANSDRARHDPRVGALRQQMGLP